MKHIIHKHRKRAFFSTLFVALLLFFVLRSIGWIELYNALLSVKVRYLILAFLASFLILITKSKIWHISISGLGYHLKYRKALILVYATQFLNAVIPVGAIGSKPLTAHILNKNTHIPTERSLAAITISDFLRMSTLFVISWAGLIIFMSSGHINPLTISIFSGSLIIGAVIAISFLILWKKERWLDAVGLFLGSLVIRIKHFFEKGSKAWEKHFKKDIEMEIHIYEKTLHDVVNEKATVIKSIGLSLVEWAFTVGLFYLILYGMNIQIPWMVLILILASSSLVVLIPIPTGFGGTELILGSFLVLLGGITAAEAAIATILFRTFYCWLPMLIGIWGVSYLSGTKITPTDLVPMDLIKNPLAK
ncbi:MAG: lysylphosphatidylglycerol synthase transmembrane domain-containing protein [Candidatus Heimdallarchaeaceae archaeon]